MPKITKSEAASELRKLAVILDDPTSDLEDCAVPLNSDRFAEALDLAIQSISSKATEFPVFSVEARFAIAAENREVATLYALRIAGQNHDGSQGHAYHARVIE